MLFPMKYLLRRRTTNYGKSVPEAILRLANIREVRMDADRVKALSDKMKSLTGDTEIIALVTGGAHGMGLAFVTQLLRIGAKAVAVADRDVENGKKMEQSFNQSGQKKVKFFKADVTNARELQSAFEKTMKLYKHLNIVVNNAKLLDDRKWELAIETNVTHFVRSSLLAINYMGKNNGYKGGIVINNSSILGLQPFVGCPIYTATEHFHIGLTRSLGTPYFKNITNIEYMALCPGVTVNPLTKDANKLALDVAGPSTAEELARAIDELPNQSTEDCAKHLTAAISQGENGSVWVSEGGLSYEVAFPERQTLRKH